MTSVFWQSQWEKSILTVCEIHTVTNKGHSCSSTLGTAGGERGGGGDDSVGGLSGYPHMGPCGPFLCPSLLHMSHICRQTCTNVEGRTPVTQSFADLCSSFQEKRLEFQSYCKLSGVKDRQTDGVCTRFDIIIHCERFTSVHGFRRRRGRTEETDGRREGLVWDRG